ncbi:transglycosylase SLT domain-containing protein [Vampirovibrio sp.]|uniref:lytic transglycosylase domain-containing protein n=1 Tax=Vampirovibrio sp. TaxID=2717857 RepID=UPI0035948B6E
MSSSNQPFSFFMKKAKTIAVTKPIQPKPRNVFSALAFGTLGVISVLLAFLWLTQQTSWLPAPIKNVLVSGGGDDHRIFTANVTLNRQDARALYRSALTDLQESNYEAALSKFKRLESVYPGLQDFLWLHEAEAYAGQGNEWAVQKKLTALVDKQALSPFGTVALYRIGQSQFRGSEWAAAQKTFSEVRNLYPNTDYALGSLYYLGALFDKEAATQPQAIASLKGYLSQCPNCKFSAEAADLLEQRLTTPNAEEHTLIGLGGASASKDLKKTLSHLAKGNRPSTWLTLGKTQIRAEQITSGVQTLTNGLPFATQLDEVREAVDTILAHTPDNDKKIALLKAISLKLPNPGGDYVLWKLAQLDEAQANGLYQQIVQNYPKGDYAPESGWQLLWPLLSSGQDALFIQQGQAYLSRYPYSKAAPKVLFWIAKRLEKSQSSQATQTYQRLVDKYPGNYYAFRAKGRLNVLVGGKPDPGWPTLTNRIDYPPAPTDFNTLDIIPEASQFGPNEQGWQLKNTAKELQRIGAADDLKLLATETMGKVPPALESWAAQVSGDRAKGLRAMRDGLEQQVKDSFINSGGADIQPAGTTDELKLLYPLYFSDRISGAAVRNKLDPFLIQSLMREESYFNEFAISTSNARGLMQLLPSTAKEVAGWEGLSNFQTSDLFSPDMNIRLGSRYLAHLHSLFSGNAMPAVGAYNGGPNAMKRWVQGSSSFNNDPDFFVEKIPYEQSRDYIKKVFTSYWNYSRLYSQPAI